MASVLSCHPTEKMIACVESVVELLENRELLKEFGGILVHVMREEE